MLFCGSRPSASLARMRPVTTGLGIGESFRKYVAPVASPGALEGGEGSMRLRGRGRNRDLAAARPEVEVRW
jgi:hypothetical protein